MSRFARLRWLAPLLAVSFLAIPGRGWPLRRFIVADGSMRPTLLPGDRLLALRPPWDRAVRAGDIVVAHDPEVPVRLLVKRVASVASDRRTVLLLGDNRAASHDSRAFGPVPRSMLAGRVVWRYLPGPRRGRVQRPVRAV